MKKRLLIAVVVVVMMLTAALVSACHKKIEEQPDSPSYDVSLGTSAVGTAIENAVRVENAENVFLSFSFVVNNGDDTYNEIYEFAALLDLDNDQNCSLSYKQYTDINLVTSTEIYYTEGTLYLNKKPVVDRVSLANVSLSQIASTLVTSAQSGQINSILQLLPALGDRIFSACERTQEGDLVTYTFAIDYQQIENCVNYFVSQVGLLNAEEVTHLLRLSTPKEQDSSKIVFVTKAVEGVGEVFVSADCLTTSGTEDAATTASKAMRSFSCVVLSDAERVMPDYQVKMPDNLSAFTASHPANIDVTGTLELDISDTTQSVYVGPQPMIAAMTNETYSWDVSLQSNVDASGNWTASYSMVNRANRDRSLRLYYANNVLYVDLSALSLGRWQLPAAKLQEIAQGLNRTRSAQTLSATDYRDILLDLLVDREVQSEQIVYSIDSDTVVKLYNAIQQVLTQNTMCTLPALQIDDAQLIINTKNNSFRSIALSASIWGSELTFEAERPSIGAPVTVVKPDWADSCVNPLEAATITPTARGVIRHSTSITLSNTALLETLLKSVSGTEIDLGDKEIYFYNFALNLSGAGKITAMSVDFDNDHNERVCSLYYHADSPHSLFVIAPTTGKETSVTTLSLKRASEMPFVDFLNVINGNADIRAEAECTFTNKKDEYAITWSNAGLEALLAKLSTFLPEQTITSVPNDLGLQSLILNGGSKKSLRLQFADRYIDFSVETLSVTDKSLALPTASLPLPDKLKKGVSYFSDYKLPQSVTVTIGDGKTNDREMIVSLSDFNTDWRYDGDLPALGDDEQWVTAYSTVFGQRVELRFIVDCANPTSVVIPDKEGNVFEFDRYSGGSPIETIVDDYKNIRVSVSNSSGVVTTSLLALRWLRAGVDIADATEAEWKYSSGDSGNDYAISPAVTNFFGKTVTLNAFTGDYYLRLKGNKVAKIKNPYITLDTYSNEASYDPFAQSTYNAGLVFQTDTNIDITDIDASMWKWDTDSIDNYSANGIKDATGKDYSKAALQNALRTELYKLSGKYTLEVCVYNTLGVVDNRISVIVTVRPYVISAVTFSDFATGVSYEALTDNPDYLGKFNVSARTYNSINNSFIFAKKATATVYFTDDSGANTQKDITFDANDWTVSSIDEVVMFQSYKGKRISLTLGNSIGGMQTVNLYYEILAQPIKSVSLWGWKDGARTEILSTRKTAAPSTKNLSFSLTDLNPYDYILPEGLVLCFEDKDDAGDPKDVSIFLDNCNFDFADWNGMDIWHNTTPYTCSTSIYGINVEISMQFAEKQITGAWFFADGCEEAPNGNYVFDSKEGMIRYDSAKHTGMTRYTLYEEHLAKKWGAYVRVDDDDESLGYRPYNALVDSDKTTYTFDYVVSTPNVYTEDDDGEYVYLKDARLPKDSGAVRIVDSQYVLLDPANLAYLGEADHRYDFARATRYQYTVDKTDADYIIVKNVYVHLIYDETLHQGMQRYTVSDTAKVIYRLASEARLVIDPNDVDYRCKESYPSKVIVGFKDGTSAVLDAVWDLTSVQTVAPEDGYSGTVKLYIPLSQELERTQNGIYMHIESTRPKATYCSDETGSEASRKTQIELTLLDVVEEHLIINDLTASNEASRETLEALIHAAICGCDKPNCKGYLYFYYGEDATTNDGTFPITEWKDLGNIVDAYRRAIRNNPDVALQEVSATAEITAVAHNLSIPVKVSINASQMSTTITFPEKGMPLISSSISSAGTSIYSMRASAETGTALSVDPYVADIFNAANYPKLLSFAINGKQCATYIDSWDLSALKDVVPYEGTSEPITVYAQIHTPMGNVRVAVPLSVDRRIIKSVSIDGASGVSTSFYINIMGSEPFGSDIITENGREYALKTVNVTFDGDDLTYHMTMRYDITDIKGIPFYAAKLADNVDVYVGNAAGGYQTLSRYNIYAKANDIMQIVVPDTDPSYDKMKPFFQDGEGNWDGVIYRDDRFLSFTTTDPEKQADAEAAWHALLISTKTLDLYCGNEYGTTRYQAKIGSAEDIGIGFCWERKANGYMYLNVWNTLAFANEHIESLQSVSTGNNRYIALARGMMNINAVSVDTSSLTVSYTGSTVENFLKNYEISVVIGEKFTTGELSSVIYSAEGTELKPSDTLNVGEYRWVISINNDDNLYYRNAITIAITVNPRILTSVTVTIEHAAGNVIDGFTFSSTSGAFLTITATPPADTSAITFRYYDKDGNLRSKPTSSGSYEVELVCSNGNYTVDLGNGKGNRFLLNIT